MKDLVRALVSGSLTGYFAPAVCTRIHDGLKARASSTVGTAMTLYARFAAHLEPRWMRSSLPGDLPAGWSDAP
jgi:hypothetical protein